MSWFKTDDQLPDHRKARSVRKSHPVKRRDVSPFGLWVLAGAWSSDGFVPLEILEDWDDDAFEMAERLVAAGLWHATERDGEPGYIFHDWHDQNPVKDDDDPSKAGTFGNHIRWHVQRKIVQPECDHCPNEDVIYRGDDRPDIAPISPPDIGVIGGESLPSRPDPTRPRPEPKPTTLSDQSDEPDRFDEFWAAYDKKVGRKKVEQKWRLALKKPGITADLLIQAALSYVAFQRDEGKHPQFTKDPATWLNGEHWTDERAGRAQPQTNTERHMALVRHLAEQEQGPTIPQIGSGR